jgi:hypothetical protein
MEPSNLLESYRLFRELKMGFGRSAPNAHSFVALHRHPRHLNGIVAACGNAVLVTAARIRAWQNGNPSGNFETFSTAYFNAVVATGALAGVDYGYPFGFHNCNHP